MKKTLIALLVVIIIIIAAIVISNKAAAPEPAVMQDQTQQPQTATSSSAFTLASSAFASGASIPSVYTCDGYNTNPPLSLSNVPTGTQSIALTMYDPDVPKAVLAQGYFNHWVDFNIPATTTEIAASSTIGISGNNGANAAAYTGPCPPSQYEPKEHRYIFTAYALDTQLNLKKGATRAQVESAIAGHVLASSTLLGRYQKVSQ